MITANTGKQTNEQKYQTINLAPNTGKQTNEQKYQTINLAPNTGKQTNEQKGQTMIYLAPKESLQPTLTNKQTNNNSVRSIS